MDAFSLLIEDIQRQYIWKLYSLKKLMEKNHCILFYIDNMFVTNFTKICYCFFDEWWNKRSDNVNNGNNGNLVNNVNAYGYAEFFKN